MFEYVIDLGLKPSSPYKLRKKTNIIILHHFESDSTPQAVHDYHLSKGNKGIDYNIVVRKNGDVVWGRGLEYEGGHVSNKYFKTIGVNARSVGIACQGNFNKITMSDAQFKSLQRVVRDVMEYYGITEVKTHGQIAGKGYTDCPGKYFPDVADILRPKESLNYVAIKDTVLIKEYKLIKKDEAIKLDSYFNGDYLGRAYYKNELGNIIFEDFKKGE